jgi:hypothetical protein
MMLRAAMLLAALTGPAPAQGLIDQAFCAALWATARDHAAGAAPIGGAAVTARDGGCEFTDVLVDLPGEYTPDWRADRLWLAGAALPWAMGAGGPPDRLDLRVEGLRYSVTTGMAQMDYILAAQARAQPIAARLSLAWGDGVLTIEDLTVDFPGENLLHLTARIHGLELGGSPGLPKADDLRLMAADVVIQTHGLFEAYALSPLATQYLPSDGDVAGAAEALMNEVAAKLRALPEPTFPPETRDALVRFVGEWPNPSGRLVGSLRTDQGIDIGNMLFVEDLANPLGPGVTVLIGWTHEDAP